jgi:hypothetical protein
LVSFALGWIDVLVKLRNQESSEHRSIHISQECVMQVHISQNDWKSFRRTSSQADSSRSEIG